MSRFTSAVLNVHQGEGAGHHNKGTGKTCPIVQITAREAHAMKREHLFRLSGEGLRRFTTIVIAAALIGSGCAVKRTTKVAPAAVAPPPVETSADALAAKLQKQRQSIQTLTATVALEPTTGSVYSGLIKEYHDVRAFILVQSPDHIRMAGQAPVVRTAILDMASDGRQFEVSIPPRQKFIVGSAESPGTSKKSLENLRPQHILDALLVPAPDASTEKWFLNQERQDART